MALRGAQRGSALIISLVFLLLLTILGVGAMQSSTLQERMSGNVRDQNIAFQAAESAIRAAEKVVKTTSNFENTTPGLREQINDEVLDADFWLTEYQWNDTAGETSGSQKYTGSLGTSGEGAPAEVPRYVIEEITSQAESPKLEPKDGSAYYRITARGVGATKDTVVILQTFFKK